MLGALLLLLAPLAQTAAPAPAPVVAESEHYHLVAYPPFDASAEYLALAEALYAQLERYFGAQPAHEGKLEVRFWPTVEGYHQGGLSDGIPEPSLASGGIYWTGTSVAYFWRQPSESFTRHLFLHELTHQFQFLSVMHNQGGAPDWYNEGLAEQFGYHHWDGATLETGEDDVLGLELDIPRMSEQGRAGTYDVCAVVEGSAGAGKPTSWAAVHYLLSGPDAELTRRFRALEPRIWSGELRGAELVRALFGADRAAARDAVNRWLASLRTTWQIEWIHWDSRGADLVGESGVVALVRTRAVYEHGGQIQATLHEESGSAGLVLAFRSTSDFLALYRRPGGRLELVQRTSAGWKTLAAADGPAGASVELAAQISDSGSLRVRAGGEERLRLELGEQAAHGAFGLFSDAGRTRFSGIALPSDPRR